MSNNQRVQARRGFLEAVAKRVDERGTVTYSELADAAKESGVELISTDEIGVREVVDERKEPAVPPKRCIRVQSDEERVRTFAAHADEELVEVRIPSVDEHAVVRGWLQRVGATRDLELLDELAPPQTESRWLMDAATATTLKKEHPYVFAGMEARQRAGAARRPATRAAAALDDPVAR